MKTINEIFKIINDGGLFYETIVDSVHTEDIFGNTALHIVSSWGDTESIKTLLEAGADINKIGEDGFTALHDAVEQNQIEAVKYLVSKGAKSIENIDGDSPIKLAERLKHFEIVEFLNTVGI